MMRNFMNNGRTECQQDYVCCNFIYFTNPLNVVIDQCTNYDMTTDHRFSIKCKRSAGPSRADQIRAKSSFQWYPSNLGDLPWSSSRTKFSSNTLVEAPANWLVGVIMTQSYETCLVSICGVFLFRIEWAFILLPLDGSLQSFNPWWSPAALLFPQHNSPCVVFFFYLWRPPHWFWRTVNALPVAIPCMGSAWRQLNWLQRGAS